MKNRTFGEHNAALNYVLQFADISRPGVLQENPHCLLRNRVDGFAHALRGLLQERRDELRNIGMAFAKRRNVKGNDIQAVVQV